MPAAWMRSRTQASAPRLRRVAEAASRALRLRRTGQRTVPSA